MTKFRALETLIIYSDISEIRALIKIKLCRNAGMQMHVSKNNRFSTQEAINFIPCTKRRKKVPVCEMFESSGSLSSSMLPNLFWKRKIIAYRGRSTVPASFKLELFSQYLMTS